MLVQLPPCRTGYGRQHVVYGGVLYRIDMIARYIFAVRGPGQVAIRHFFIAVRGKPDRIAAGSGPDIYILILYISDEPSVRRNTVRGKRGPPGPGAVEFTASFFFFWQAVDILTGYFFTCAFCNIYIKVFLDGVFEIITVPERSSLRLPGGANGSPENGA